MTPPYAALAPTVLPAGDLLLRPFEPADEPAVAVAMRDPEILRWAAGVAVAHAPEVERARTWLAPRIAGWAGGTAAFAVTAAADGGLLGCLSVREVNRLPDQGLVSYWVTPAARGRGVASGALDAAAAWAFAPPGRGGLGLHRLSLDHALVNTGSCAVALRAGFRTEGTMRECFVDPSGERHDSHLHARLATDGPGGAAPLPAG